MLEGVFVVTGVALVTADKLMTTVITTSSVSRKNTVMQIYTEVVKR